MKATPVRKYLSIDDLQKEYLPMSKKKLRVFAKKYLSVKVIGGRMYVSRELLEKVLAEQTEQKPDPR